MTFLRIVIPLYLFLNASRLSRGKTGTHFSGSCSSGNRASSLQLDIIVPVIMSCALLWWVSRGMSWTTRLVVTVVTLVLILCIVLFERSGFWSTP